MRGGVPYPILSLPSLLRHQGRLPWGGPPYTPKTWGSPIEVTMIGNHVVTPIFPTCLGLLESIDCEITFLAPLSGNINSIFLKRHIFDKPFPQSLLIYKLTWKLH
jgi:hypothetical protein